MDRTFREVDRKVIRKEDSTENATHISGTGWTEVKPKQKGNCCFYINQVIVKLTGVLNNFHKKRYFELITSTVFCAYFPLNFAIFFSSAHIRLSDAFLKFRTGDSRQLCKHLNLYCYNAVSKR